MYGSILFGRNSFTEEEKSNADQMEKKEIICLEFFSKQV